MRRENGDTFGADWYYVGASKEFGSVRRPLLDPQVETGMELFYHVQANRWLNVTPNVPYILPGNRAIADDAFA